MKQPSEGKGIKREIKFRAFAGYKMEYFELGDTVPYYYPDENSPAVEYEPVMQYTGLKDKNGKEIYEGDIVKTDSHWNGDYHVRELNLEVKFENGCFITDSMGEGLIADYFNKRLEVIGNIYENPELLINHPTHHYDK